MNRDRPDLPTSDEIDRRLRIVSQLRNLCLSLGKARPIESENSISLTPEPLPQSPDAAAQTTGS